MAARKAQFTKEQAKEVVDLFVKRCNLAKDVWKNKFYTLLDRIENFCSKCSTDEQFNHYVSELFLFAGFINAETQTLLYGRIVFWEEEILERESSMLLAGGSGDFEDPFDNSDNCKLTLCSFNGLGHLRKIGVVMATDDYI